jgi:hypothetical protein
LLRSSYALGALLGQPVRFDGEAELEVHTLVGHDSTVLYLLAIKSLHRHVPSARVLIHDDGTLTRADRLLLGFHVRGARLIAKRLADALVARRLLRYPALLRARADNVRLCQIVDYHVLADAEHVVGMDSDIAFLARPETVLAWAQAGPRAPSILYSPERDPRGPHWIPALMPAVPYVADLCCGFVCVRRRQFFAPAALERLVATVPDQILAGRRFVTQMLYSLMAARPGQSAVSLGPLYESGRLRWLPDSPERVLCHYFASHQRCGAAQSLLEERELFARLAAHGLPRLAERWWGPSVSGPR